MPRADKYNNNLVGKPRPDGKLWKLLHDDVEIEMMREWFMGAKPILVYTKYGITKNQFYHQLYHHAKRLMHPLFKEVFAVFKIGGSKALMKKYEISIHNANRLYLMSKQYNMYPMSRYKRKCDEENFRGK